MRWKLQWQPSYEFQLFWIPNTQWIKRLGRQFAARRVCRTYGYIQWWSACTLYGKPYSCLELGLRCNVSLVFRLAVYPKETTVTQKDRGCNEMSFIRINMEPSRVPLFVDKSFVSTATSCNSMHLSPDICDAITYGTRVMWACNFIATPAAWVLFFSPNFCVDFSIRSHRVFFVAVKG